MGLLSQIFTWWNGQTIGTRFYTWRKGGLVGTDETGNRYYQARDETGRRWVIYNGVVEATRVPPEWHGWLHHTVDEPPESATGANYAPHAWEKPHQPNLTGTPLAYRPAGSLSKSHAPATTGPASGQGAYQPWQPD